MLDQSLSQGGNHGTIEAIGLAYWTDNAWFRRNAWLLWDGLTTIVSVPFASLGINWETSLWAWQWNMKCPETDILYPIFKTQGTSFGDADHFQLGVEWNAGGNATVFLQFGTYQGREFLTLLPDREYVFQLLYTAGATDKITVTAQLLDAATDTPESVQFTLIPATIATNFNAAPPAFIHFGRSPFLRSGEPQQFYKGWMRDVRMFQTLTSLDPVAWWPLDDVVPDGGQIKDQQGGEHHGTLVTLGDGLWTPIYTPT